MLEAPASSSGASCSDPKHTDGLVDAQHQEDDEQLPENTNPDSATSHQLAREVSDVPTGQKRLGSSSSRTRRRVSDRSSASGRDRGRQETDFTAWDSDLGEGSLASLESDLDKSSELDACALLLNRFIHALGFCCLGVFSAGLALLLVLFLPPGAELGRRRVKGLGAALLLDPYRLTFAAAICFQMKSVGYNVKHGILGPGFVLIPGHWPHAISWAIPLSLNYVLICMAQYSFGFQHHHAVILISVCIIFGLAHCFGIFLKFAFCGKRMMHRKGDAGAKLFHSSAQRHMDLASIDGVVDDPCGKDGCYTALSRMVRFSIGVGAATSLAICFEFASMALPSVIGLLSMEWRPVSTVLLPVLFKVVIDAVSKSLQGKAIDRDEETHCMALLPKYVCIEYVYKMSAYSLGSVHAIALGLASQALSEVILQFLSRTMVNVYKFVETCMLKNLGYTRLPVETAQPANTAGAAVEAAKPEASKPGLAHAEIAASADAEHRASVSETPRRESRDTPRSESPPCSVAPLLSAVTPRENPDMESRSHFWLSLNEGISDHDIEHELLLWTLEGDVEDACEYVAHAGSALTLWWTGALSRPHCVLAVCIGLLIEILDDIVVAFAMRVSGNHRVGKISLKLTGPLLSFVVLAGAELTVLGITIFELGWNIRSKH